MPSRRPSRAAVALADPPDDPGSRRVLLADWCRLLGQRLGTEPSSSPSAPTPVDPALGQPTSLPSSPEQGRTLDAAVAGLELPPRVGQTLLRLLAGRSEKQIALDLNVSPHTVHTYVKQLHKRLNVSSRGELLALFVRRGEELNRPANPV